MANWLYSCPEPPLEPPDYEVPTCPCCGQECKTYVKQFGDILGCDVCFDLVDAWSEEASLA